jgi:CRP/FNR family cyclic AMP-dependent transcriptional regulator
MSSPPKLPRQAPAPPPPPRDLPDHVRANFCGPSGRGNLFSAMRRQQLFAEVPGAADPFAEVAVIEHYPMGRLVIEQGAYDADVFLVLRGELGVVIGRDFVGVRRDGDYVGEMAAIDVGHPRSARVVARTNTVVARIAAADFRSLLATFPLLHRPITLALAARLRAREAFHRVRNEKPLVFLGSSSEQCVVADALHAGLLALDHDPRHWLRDRVFKPSTFTMHGLDALARTADIAVLVLHPDDTAVTRGSDRPVPRDNLVLEFGLFAGAIGLQRTIGLRPRGAVSLPSDLNGLTFIEYDAPKPGIRFDASPICTAINEALRDLRAEET